MRDEFSAPTRRMLAERVALRCSNPDCFASTIGPRTSEEGIVNLGVAAHVTAAAAGGPRFDPALTAEQRRSATNGIWLCQKCAKLIDSDLERFSADVLRRWKAVAETRASLALGKALGDSHPADLSAAEMEILRAAALEGDIWVIKTEQGDWVRSDGTDFWDPQDPSFSAEYQDALESLQKRHLVQHQRQMLYSLTGQGFKLARTLSELR